jgi:hypothetical protein
MQISGSAIPVKLTKVMKQFNETEAKEIGNMLKIDWKEVSLEQFTMGMNVELEHGSIDPQTNVTDNDGKLTGEIALAHLKEFPDYYTRLAEMEKSAKADLKKG